MLDDMASSICKEVEEFRGSLISEHFEIRCAEYELRATCFKLNERVDETHQGNVELKSMNSRLGIMCEDQQRMLISKISENQALIDISKQQAALADALSTECSRLKGRLEKAEKAYEGQSRRLDRLESFRPGNEQAVLQKMNEQEAQIKTLQEELAKAYDKQDENNDLFEEQKEGEQQQRPRF